MWPGVVLCGRLWPAGRDPHPRAQGQRHQCAGAGGEQGGVHQVSRHFLTILLELGDFGVFFKENLF